MPIDPLSASDLRTLLIYALINPAVFMVALYFGRQADQWQKVPIAAFLAALAGSTLVWVATRFGFGELHRLGRAGAGFFVAHFLLGLAWAMAAYATRPGKSKAKTKTKTKGVGGAGGTPS